MNSTAYLVARFSTDTGVPVFRSVDILSEFPCTSMLTELQVCMYRAKAATFQDARDAVLEYARGERGKPTEAAWVYDRLRRPPRYDEHAVAMMLATKR